VSFERDRFFKVTSTWTVPHELVSKSSGDDVENLTLSIHRHELLRLQFLSTQRYRKTGMMYDFAIASCDGRRRTEISTYKMDNGFSQVTDHGSRRSRNILTLVK
jgi:hypothetical protein